MRSGKRSSKHGNPKRSFNCRSCRKRIRTRKAELAKLKVCQSCVTESVHRSLPPAKSGAKKGVLEWEIMRERWFHELMYQNLEHNQLQALGLGRLWYVNEQRQRSERKMGKYIDKEDNEYDMLLRDQSGRIICVELKRKASEAVVTQVMRYKRAVEKAGLGTPQVVIVACEIPSKVMDVIEEFQAVGWPVTAFLFSLEGSEFKLTEMTRREIRYKQDESTQG